MSDNIVNVAFGTPRKAGTNKQTKLEFPDWIGDKAAPKKEALPAAPSTTEAREEQPAETLYPASRVLYVAGPTIEESLFTLLDAFRYYIVGQGGIPYVSIRNTVSPGIHGLPDSVWVNGLCTLDISLSAIHALDVSVPQRYSFRARFDGKPYSVTLTPHMVLAVFDRENTSRALILQE